MSRGECLMWSPVDIFGHVIGGHYLYAAATAERECLGLARVPTVPVGHGHAAGAPIGARLSSSAWQLSGAVDIFEHVICGRFLHPAVMAEVGCLVFTVGPTRIVGHARAAGTPTGMRLSSAECEMSATVDKFGHVTCSRFPYEATTAEVECLVYERAPTGPVGHAHAISAGTGAHPSSAESQMWAAVVTFRHVIGGRFLHAAITAERKRLRWAQVAPRTVGNARAAGAPTGARLPSSACQLSAAVDTFEHVICGRFLHAAAMA